MRHGRGDGEFCETFISHNEYNFEFWWTAGSLMQI